MRASIEIEVVGKGASAEVVSALHKIAEEIERSLRIELDRHRDGTGGEVRASVRVTDPAVTRDVIEIDRDYPIHQRGGK